MDHFLIITHKGNFHLPIGHESVSMREFSYTNPHTLQIDESQVTKIWASITPRDKNNGILLDMFHKKKAIKKNFFAFIFYFFKT
jgi:hypothetical protein